MHPVVVDGVVDDLVATLGVEAVDVTLAGRRKASMDHAWLSPVLSARLPAEPADVVARPRSVSGIVAAARTAAAHGVPLTARGKGTGNYGQAIPLDGGIVLDTTRCDRIVDIGSGWATVEPGVPFTALEAAARATDQELALLPSTVSSCVGGFVAGGAGGAGSVEHGWLWDGFVLALDVVGCAPDAEVEAAPAEEVGAHLHAYGTTGVLTGLTVRLVPARDWVALWSSFASWTEATAAGTALLAGLGPKPRLVSVDDPDLARLVVPGAPAAAGRTSLRVVVDRSTASAAQRIVVDHGGQVDALRPGGAGSLLARSFNHVTLRAKRVDPSLCHLQVGGPALAARHDEVVACLPGAGLHLDGLGDPTGGTVGWGGLLIGRFPGEVALADARAALTAMGVHVVDPHTWELGAHGIEGTRAVAERLDPQALLNPGKLPGRTPTAAAA